MKYQPRSFATLAFLLLAPVVAFAGSPFFQAGDGAQKKPGYDLDELAKQAAAALHGITTIPIPKTEWPTVNVNDVAVRPEEFERTSIYFSGDAAIQASRIFVAVQHERKKIEVEVEKLRKEIETLTKDGKNATAEGRTVDDMKKQMDEIQGRMAKTTIPEEELKKKIEELMTRIELAYPEKSFPQWLAEQRQSMKSLEFSLRTQYEFDSMFLPVSGQWPEITINAIRALRPGLGEKELNTFIEDLKVNNANTGAKNQGDVFAMMLLRQQIIQRIVQGLEFRDALDGIPSDVALSVGGQAFKTRELFESGMGLGSYLDSLRAIQFAIIREAAKQAILAREEQDWARLKEEAKKKREAGEDITDPPRPLYWLHDGSAEYTLTFDNEKAAYPPGPFDHKGIVRFRRFPTMQVYRMYFQMFESFKRMAAAHVNEAVIKKHIEDNMLYFTNGTAEVECILYSYSSDVSVRSVEEGYASAKARAEKAIADLQKGAAEAKKAYDAAKVKSATDEQANLAAIEAARGLTFSDILDRDSDFKDPAPSPGAPPVQNPSNRGRFGSLARNPLTEKLHESELTNLLNGYSFSEQLFFRAPLGEVIGPVRGTQGYYLARVVSRNPGTKVPNVQEKAQMDLATQDYFNHAFQDFMNSAMAKTRVALAK
ncbi:MAG: hypothetical protein ACKVS6_11755 [Planctomycetota bacterium]